MATTTVRSASELTEISRRTSSDPLTVNFAVGSITLPEPLVFKHAQNLTFVGASSPTKAVVLRGAGLVFVGSKNIEFSNTAFVSDRPTDRPPERYEKSLKPLRIYGYDPAVPTENFRLLKCGLMRHTDEIEVGPCSGLPAAEGVSREDWYANHPERPAVIGLRIEDTLFGPPCFNYSADRSAHNHGLSMNCVKNVRCVRVVWCGGNKRNPQCNGTDIELRDCAMTDYQSMCIGMHAGTELTVRSCQFWRGLRNLMPSGRAIIPTCNPVEVVRDTYLTPLAKLGPCKLSMDLTSFEVSASGSIYKRGWSCYGSRFAPVGMVHRVPSTEPRVNPPPLQVLLARVGSGASHEAAIKRLILNNKGTGWAREWQV